jgi:formylglycine-generating enzyme required for sulfatase activity
MAFANSPRDRVWWYQAMAYCRWLNVKMPLDSFPNGQRGEIRLPMEWEWQLAATGGNPAYEYPWGATWDGRLANTTEAGLGRSSVVGLYPLGQARCGALDLSGNLWEWCGNEYSSVKNIDISSENEKVLRGGSWFDKFDFTRADARGNLLLNGLLAFGFRVCLLP